MTLMTSGRTVKSDQQMREWVRREAFKRRVSQNELVRGILREQVNGDVPGYTPSGRMTTRFFVRLPPDEYDVLEQAAAAGDVQMSHVVRGAVKAAMEGANQ
jgi:predicted HicB family RNase H-like nuclease